MKGSHKTREEWLRADPQVLRLLKALEAARDNNGDEGERYWTKTRDKVMREAS
jgi:hypothetical protein